MEQSAKMEGSRMASAALPEAVEPRKKSNFKYACTCAAFASMSTIVLGYGTYVSQFSNQFSTSSFRYAFWVGLDHV
jgi:hypothetical protein